MLILGIDSATPVASAALADEQGLLGEVLLNVGLTHSEQLLPMIDDLLRQCHRTVRDVTAIGISSGPGSFTGLRIGMATAKALAQGLSLSSVIAVPTLEAMAWQMMGYEAILAPMLNARREQIYTGLYRWKRESGLATEINTDNIFPARQRGKRDRLPADAGGNRWILESLSPPEAVSAEMWAARLKALKQKVVLFGDGAAIYEEIWRRDLDEEAVLLPPVLGLCRAGFVALAAMKKTDGNEACSDKARDIQNFYAMKPLYLRGI